MWKYVSRRIRDVYDKTAHVLEVRRTWNCGAGERFCPETPPGDGAQAGGEAPEADGRRYCLLHVARSSSLGGRCQKEYGTGSNQYEREGTRRKEYHQTPFEHSWLGAITWTSAIICGWYTSQLLCLYRRAQHLDHPTLGGCVSSQLLNAAAEHRRLPARHCDALAQYFGLRSGASLSAPFANPSISNGSSAFGRNEQKGNALVPSFVPFVPFGGNDFVDYTDRHRSQQQRFVFQVNNEAKPTVGVPRDVFARQSSVPVAEVPTTNPDPVSSKAETIDGAFANLLSVLGEIEYQLGCRNLELGEYVSAVSHLKLGASHHHAGAAFNLGICYEQGYGIPKDLRMALECYQLAAELGHPQAIYNVGVFHARGFAGLRPSRTMAKKYFLAAAELGLEEAIAVLGPKYRRNRKESLVASEESAVSVQPPFQFALQNVDQFLAEKQPAARNNLQLHVVAARG
uniref:Death ligand signal enhancer n=1 Tax=Anopheles dirus TaxID=7168 RepID=A0A182N584_9DIPT